MPEGSATDVQVTLLRCPLIATSGPKDVCPNRQIFQNRTVWKPPQNCFFWRLLLFKVFYR